MITQSVGSSSSRLAGRVRRRPERAERQQCSRERLLALDAELARRTGEAGRLRFEMGRGLDLLQRSGGDHALGFSSIEAYSLERCERSASWTQKARGLASRLEGLPAVADALISGSLNWSMAAVLATVATPEDADFWLAEATRRTVREMRALVSERRHEAESSEHLAAEEEMRTLTITVPREDAWCFEQAKLLSRHLSDGPSGTDAEVMLALVAESTSTLCGELPRNVVAPAEDDARDPQRAWERELARMRTEAETKCEAHLCRGRLAVFSPERDRTPAERSRCQRRRRPRTRGRLGPDLCRTCVALVGDHATSERNPAPASPRQHRARLSALGSPLSPPPRRRTAQHHVPALCLRALRRHLAPASRRRRLRADLRPRSPPLPEPLLRPSRRDPASPPLPLPRRRRLRPEPDQPVHLVPPRGHSRRPDICRAARLCDSMDLRWQSTHDR